MFASKEWVKSLLGKVLKKKLNNYSLEEQKIGTWIDGKPLYQKTITTIMPSTTTNGVTAASNINHNIENLDTIVNINTLLNTNKFTFHLPWVALLNDGSYTSYCYYLKTTDKIILANLVADYSGGTVNITLQYTKTTD